MVEGFSNYKKYIEEKINNKERKMRKLEKSKCFDNATVKGRRENLFSMTPQTRCKQMQCIIIIMWN